MSAWEAPGITNEWYTPRAVFEALGCHFDLDVAHPHDHPTYVPADLHITPKSRDREWVGFVWMNPPFGARNGLVPWLNKFFRHGNGIALVPDRTSAPWFWDSFNRSDAVLFTRKIRFVRPDGSEGKSPSCGTALMAVGTRGVQALTNARDANFGIMATPNPTVYGPTTE